MELKDHQRQHSSIEYMHHRIRKMELKARSMDREADRIAPWESVKWNEGIERVHGLGSVCLLGSANLSDGIEGVELIVVLA